MKEESSFFILWRSRIEVWKEASYLLEVEVTFSSRHWCLLLPEDCTGAPVVHHALCNTEQKQRWQCAHKPGHHHQHVVVSVSNRKKKEEIILLQKYFDLEKKLKKINNRNNEASN